MAFQIADIFLQDDFLKEAEDEEIKPGVSRSVNEEVKIDLDISSINFEEYAGNYYSKELKTTYQLYVENEALNVKIGNYTPRILEAYGGDQFRTEAEGLLFQFRRNIECITGFELDAGRVQNLKFSKE